MNNRIESITTLLFDWDGTIVDSAELGLRAFEQSFESLGLPFDHETYQAVYSPNWYSVYQAMGLPEDKWAQADELWIKHYGEQIARPVAGAQQLITSLHKCGYRLGVVSSGSDCRVAREVKELGLDGLFDVVVCNEQMENKKPHPEGLVTAMRALGTSREQTCYVGDSPEDIEMGQRAGTMTVGVSSSYPTSWKLETANPDIFINSLTELSTHFQC